MRLGYIVAAAVMGSLAVSACVTEDKPNIGSETLEWKGKSKTKKMTCAPDDDSDDSCSEDSCSDDSSSDDSSSDDSSSSDSCSDSSSDDSSSSDSCSDSSSDDSSSDDSSSDDSSSDDSSSDDSSSDDSSSDDEPCDDCPTSADELFISEYGEPPSPNGTSKYLEIYNGTGAAVDLSSYSLHVGFNGAAFPGTSVALTGTLEPCAALVVCNANADPEIADNCDAVAGGVVQFNGNDAVALANNGVVVDGVGEFGVNPGSGGWNACGVAGATLNNVLVRLPGAAAPDPDWTTTSGVGCQWDVRDGSSYASFIANGDLGMHTP